MQIRKKPTFATSLYRVALLPMMLIVLLVQTEARAAPAKLQGNWEGQAKRNTYVFPWRLTFVSKDGRWSGTAYSPLWGKSDWPLHDVQYVEGKLKFSILAEHSGREGRFEGAIFEGTLVGEYTWDGVTYECGLNDDPDLRVSGVLAPPVCPQFPEAPFPYHIEKMKVPGKVSLAGALMIPNSPGPHPAVIMLDGGEKDFWDPGVPGDPARNLWYWIIADRLARADIAVLRMNDRGLGESQGDYDATTIQELAEDARAEIGFLAQRKDINPAKIGFVGYSEGAIVATIALAKGANATFAVMIGCVGVRGGKVGQEAISLQLQSSGLDPAPMRNAMLHMDELAMTDGNAGDLAAEMKRYYAKLWAARTDPPAPMLSPERFQSTIDYTFSLRGRSNARYDPGEDLRRVKCPVLVLHGEKDVRVVTTQNVPVVTKALNENPNAGVHVLKGLAHGLWATSNGADVTDYNAIDPDALDQIVSWVTLQSGITKKAASRPAASPLQDGK
jgi:pimeloyl-ACP methyl ester carboxylesterase